MRNKRKTRLVDCNPRLAPFYANETTIERLVFDCPEGHEGCKVTVPFSPAMDGNARPSREGRPVWDRTGDTFETMTLSPSIRCRPIYRDRADAIAQGADPQYITERLFCAFHGFIKNGRIEFCGDSR